MLLSAAIAAGYPYATRVPTVPDSVLPLQFRKWLLKAGKLDAVTASIESIADPAERAEAVQSWDYALSIPRRHPLVIEIGQKLGMTDADLDAAFLEAATL